MSQETSDPPRRAGPGVAARLSAWVAAVVLVAAAGNAAFVLAGDRGTVAGRLVEIGLVSAAAIALGVVGAFAVSSRIVGPLRELSRAAERVGAGHLDERIEVATRDEIGLLAQSFNRMTVRLKDVQAELIEKHRMEEDLRIAREIQQSLLPTAFPEVPGYAIAALYRAAREVGGDYYDVLELGDGKVGCVVADVSGKGISGSLGMAICRTMLRAQAAGEVDAARVLVRTNRQLWHEFRRGMFVSVLYAVLDGPGRRLHVASAGHSALLWYRAQEDRVESVCPPGIALGLDPGPLFERRMRGQEIRPSAGDILLLYTDGVTEAMNAEHEELGDAALVKLLRAGASGSADALVQRVADEVDRFAAGTPQSDDITILAVKVAA